MTQWRDARLQRALETAPDAQLRPGSAVRRALSNAARQALAPGPPASIAWWKKVFPSAAGERMPWNAAFATVALASLVTLLWQGQEIPGASPQVTQADRPAPAAKAPVRTEVAKAGPPPAEAARERRADPAGDVLKDRQDRFKSSGGGAHLGATSQKGDAAAARAPSAPPAAAGAAQSAPAPAPAPALASEATSARPLARSATSLTALSQQREAAVPDEWTQVRIDRQGRSVELPREQAQRLHELVSRLARAAPSQEAFEGPVLTRVELKEESELTGVIELSGPHLRWTRRRTGQRVTTLPDPAQLQALQGELDRLLGR